MRGLTKRFGGFTAVNGASFKVELGNSLGILARNGTGKTTIINMMAGLEKPDEGKVTCTSRVSFPLGFMGDGRDTAQQSLPPRAPEGVNPESRTYCGRLRHGGISPPTLTARRASSVETSGVEGRIVQQSR